MNADARCPWCGSDPLYRRYHDEEWGVPLRSAQGLFEFLLLEGMQAGLSWLTILRKREHFRAAFAGFDAERVARFDGSDLDRLMQDAGIVRNRLKIEAAIGNARAWLALQQQGDPTTWLWQFVDGTPVQNRWQHMGEVPACTPASDAMSKELKRRGFRFVGSTICYAFMQATGMVNDHLQQCPRHAACAALAR